MNNAYLRLTAESHPRAEDIDTIENAVYRYNMATTNNWSYTQVVHFLRDEGDRIHGGIVSGIWGGWLRINFLWVADGLRGQGFGTSLLEAAEAQAHQHQCQGILLETHSFQAKPFYERHGYEVVGEVPDYPAGHGFYMLRKLLAPAANGHP